jgi:uncharacterized protein YjaZ
MIFRTFIFLCLFLSSLYADGVYDLNVLSLQAKVFPKVILTDTDIANKTSNNTIVITILYDKIDTQTAIQFQKMVQRNYKTLKGFDLSVRLLQYKNFSQQKKLSSAYFFLLTDNTKQLTSIAHEITKEHRLTFCYDEGYLDYGVMMGLDIREKVSLSLDLKTLKQSKIKLQNSIFKVVKIR